jgi:sulfide dehydrogenase [flavocytochrome c] flavoprotein subunit
VGVMRRRELLSAAVCAALAAAARARVVLEPDARAARVVIVGGGFAGSCCALQLRNLNPHLAVTLIDGADTYVTCPMSDGVMTGQRALAAITVGRSGLAQAGVRFVPDVATAIDPARRRVHLRSGAALDYDKAVVAPGIRLLFGTPQGYDEAATLRMPHAWQAGAQTRLLAAQLRATADGDTLAISVPAGLMRCPPGPYARAGMMAEWLLRHRKRNKILIFDGNNHFPRQDVFTAAWNKLYPGMIEWLAPGDGGNLTRVDVRTRTLYSSSGAHRVALANIIPPQAAGQLAVDAALASPHGWCPVDARTFESQLVPHIHVIGDACIAGAMPKAASAAASQAHQCAAAIAAALGVRTMPQPSFDSVCYSLLGERAAFAIRATFEVADGQIRQVAAVADAPEDRTVSAQHAQEAEDWYQQLRAKCFGS